MTETQRAVLRCVQNGVPLVERPYAAVAAETGITEEECIECLRELAGQGILRAVRAVLSWGALGYETVLVGVVVEDAFRDDVAAQISREEGVTHNYGRQGAFNLWFTLIYECEQYKTSLLESLRARAGVGDVREFRAQTTYKIGLVLDV